MYPAFCLDSFSLVPFPFRNYGTSHSIMDFLPLPSNKGTMDSFDDDVSNDD